MGLKESLPPGYRGGTPVTNLHQLCGGRLVIEKTVCLPDDVPDVTLVYADQCLWAPKAAAVAAHTKMPCSWCHKAGGYFSEKKVCSKVNRNKPKSKENKTQPTLSVCHQEREVSKLSQMSGWPSEPGGLRELWSSSTQQENKCAQGGQAGSAIVTPSQLSSPLSLGRFMSADHMRQSGCLKFTPALSQWGREHFILFYNKHSMYILT